MASVPCLKIASKREQNELAYYAEQNKNHEVILVTKVTEKHNIKSNI